MFLYDIIIDIALYITMFLYDIIIDIALYITMSVYITSKDHLIHL
jgi:hypothetical protein